MAHKTVVIINGNSKACSVCGVVKVAEDYYKSSARKPLGRDSKCKECKNALNLSKARAKGIPEARRSVLLETEKQCLCCDQILSLDCFVVDKSCAGGKATKCKECQNMTGNKESQDRAKRKYRESRGKVLYLEERVKAFERRTGRSVVRSYTVNKAFVDALYEAASCYYCAEITPLDQKSTDHKIPLERGGSHTRENLCMACFSCNSSKAAMTEDEFVSSGRLARLVTRRNEVRQKEVA